MKRFLVAATVAAVLVATGGLAAYAVNRADATQTLYACVSKAGDLKMVSFGTPCGKGSNLVSWNAQGPAGPQGPQGETGPAGPQGAAGADGKDGATLPAGGTVGQVLKSNGSGGLLWAGDNDSPGLTGFHMSEDYVVARIAPHGYGGGMANCPAGEVVIGGGGSTYVETAGAYLDTIASVPQQAGYDTWGWHVVAYNPTDYSVSMTILATCARVG